MICRSDFRRRRAALGAVLVALLTAACAPQARASIYYVDYQLGSDTADGASPEKAWKHAPGDPEATGRPSSIRLQPGDTVRFKGGVAYRGTIVLPADGAAASPITYAGDQWGAEGAIIDGGDPVKSVKPCPSAAACGGADNWRQLSLVTFTPPKTKLIKFFDSAGPLFESQYPRAKDPFFSDDVQEYVETSLSEVEGMKQGRLRSPQLADALAKGATGAVLSIWTQGNWVVRRPIRSVSGDVIEFTPEDLKPYVDRPGRAAVVSAVGQVDQPGFYAVIAPGQAVVWLRARDGAPDAGLTVGDGRKGFDLAGRSDVVVRGLIFQHFVANEYGEGVQISNSGGVSQRARIEGNTFRRSSLFTGDGAIMIGKVDGAQIVGNTFEDLERGSGIRTPGRPLNNLEIIDNRFHRLGQTGILAMGVTGLKISGNVMSDLYGIHGNGISLYMDNRNSVVSQNRITNSTRPMTFHGESLAEAKNPGDHDMLIEGNFFATPSKGAPALVSYGETRGVTIRDNILIAPAAGLSLSAKDERIVVTGNRTTGIQTKGAEPSGWKLDNNGKPSAEELKAAAVR